MGSDSFPRVLVAFLVAIAGGFALLSSFVMLNLGLERMALRYPVALLFGYVFFLFLLWLWLRKNADSYFDVPEPGISFGSGSAPSGEVSGESLPSFKGEGGEFGGGGATGSFDSPSGLVHEESTGSIFNDVGEPIASVAEAEELAIPILVALFALAIALASFYVIYIAPVLLSEVLVDGVLSYALFRKMKGLESPHWVQSVFRRTFWPLLATAVTLSVAGYLLSTYAPGAHSIGEAVRQMSTKSGGKDV